MAITNKGELKTAISEWADATDVSSYLDDFVSQTTLLLNYGSQDISPLRTREMTVVTTLTSSGGAVTLPDDYLEYRRVVDDGSSRRDLRMIAPSAADQLYPSSAAGIACDFTIIGTTLQTYPATASDIELTYFQIIPEMAADTDTNWLLTKNPAVYLQGGLYHLALLRRDDVLAQRSAGLFKSYIDGMSRADFMSQFARSVTRLKIAP